MPVASEISILVSGAGSGLGKFLCREMSGRGFDKDVAEADWNEFEAEGADTIIHCAARADRGSEMSGTASLSEDDIMLAERLLACPHKRFVFISTIDIYRHKPGPHFEDEKIEEELVEGQYARSKLLLEELIAEKASKPLILRCSSLVGKDSRNNSLMRLLNEDGCKLTLSGESSFNYVLHSDIRAFVKLAIENDIAGLFNVASTGNIKLADLADKLGRSVTFGTYRYDATEIDNRKIVELCSNFKKSSLEAVEAYLESLS